MAFQKRNILADTKQTPKQNHNEHTCESAPRPAVRSFSAVLNDCYRKIQEIDAHLARAARATREIGVEVC